MTAEDDVRQAKYHRPAVAVLPGQLHFTDLGNAQRLIARYRGEIRYCPPRKKWLVWDGRRWAVDETDEVMRLAKETVAAIYEEGMAVTDTAVREKIMRHAFRSEAAARLSAMITLAESEPGIPVLPADLDADPWLLNVSNGTLDLRTGELRKHRRDDLITKVAPVEYHADARSDLWDEFLTTATGGDPELAAYLARVVGYSLQGTATEKAFFFMYGPPDTAKSTFIKAVSGVLGDYHASAKFDTWLVQTHTGGNRGDLVRLAGVRLVTSVEVRRGAKFDEALLRQITGGDLVTEAAKYEHEVEFLPQATLLLAANDAPAIRDDDEGMWNRVRRIPFTVVIPEDQRDRRLPERLAAPDVQSAILAWAVRGCVELQARGVGTCAAVKASSAEYRKSQDRVAGFLGERCLFGAEEQVTSKALRDAYLTWCDENRVRPPLTDKEMAKRLAEHGCTSRKVGGARGWHGVRLLGPDEQPPTQQQGRDGQDRTDSPGTSAIDLSREESRENVSCAVLPSSSDSGDTFADWVDREVGPL